MLLIIIMISEDTNPNCHYKVTVWDSMRPSYQKRDLKSDATKPFFFAQICCCGVEFEASGVPDTELMSRVCVFVSARRRDAPAAAQGLSDGRLREGQRGGQKPGYGGICPAEAPAVCLTGPVTQPSLCVSITGWTGLDLWDLLTWIFSTLCHFSGPTVSVGNTSHRTNLCCFFFFF